MTVRKAGKYGRLSPHPKNLRPRVTLEEHFNLSVLPNLTGKTVDWCSKVPDWPMYLNDQIGDCTCAAVGHNLQAWTAYSSKEYSIANKDVLRLYEAVGGYIPGDPSTDNGAVIQDVMQYWHDNGVNGHKIDYFAEVQNYTDVYLLKACLDVFGSVYLGVNLPVSAEDEFNAAEPWSYDPFSSIAGGHAIVLQKQYPVGTVHGTMDVITWGAVQPMTFGFVEHYVEEAWVAISTDWLESNGSAPNGLNLNTLKEDFSYITGQNI